MSYWIADALHREREASGVSEADFGTSLGVDKRTIERLEAGQSMGRDIDRYVAAYAHLLGIEDGRDLWMTALTRWQRDGAPPRFEPITGPAAAFAEAIRLEALRSRPSSSGSSAKRRATR